MTHSINIDSQAVLNLLNQGVISTGDISLYDFQKQSEPNDSDKELFERVVRQSEDKYNVKQIGWLSEQLGLECLKSDDFRFKYVEDYEVPHSHKDFLNTLSKEQKSKLKGSFLGTQIKIEFVPKTQPVSLKVKEIEGFKLVVLPNNGYFTKVSRLGDKTGYVVESLETSAQLRELIFQIGVAKEKAIFKNPGSGTWWKYFGMPSIEPTFSETDFSFSVKGDWREASIDVQGKIATGFQIVGDLESIENIETESIYMSDYSMNSLIIQVAKDLGVKSVDQTYVVKGNKPFIETEFTKRLKEIQMKGVAEITAYAQTLGIDCEVSTDGFKFYPSVIVEEGQFQFMACLDSRYGSYSVEMAKEWLDNFCEEAIKDSYAWEKSYKAFLAKDLPTV